MDRYIIEIRKEGQYVAVEPSGNTPCLLADKIKEVVREFFKDDESQ